MYCKLTKRTSKDIELSKITKKQAKHIHILEFRAPNTVDNYGHYILKKRIKKLKKRTTWKTV